MAMITKKMKKNGFISFQEFKKKSLSNPSVKKAYDALEFDFQIIRALIDARSKKNLTQQELARKIGVEQSALARFESGKVDPRLTFLKKVTSGLGLKLIVR